VQARTFTFLNRGIIDQHLFPARAEAGLNHGFNRLRRVFREGPNSLPNCARHSSRVSFNEVRSQTILRVRHMKCPICGAPTKWKDNPNRPFCSERCRIIDLGRWAGEEYSVSIPLRDVSEDTEQREQE
jgi:endogenous inhibitor of DNA gyrase (YacG/DUF329 family)